MADITQLWQSGSGRSLLLLGAVLIYAASRVGTEALAGKGDSPGRRAVGHWIPIAAAALAATATRREDLAVVIIFSTSVACLSLFLGTVAIAAPGAESPATLRRLWPFVLPAALLTLLAGFSATLTWVHGVMLLVEGAVLLATWRELGRVNEAGPVAGVSWVSMVILAACVLVALVGGAAGVFGATRVARELPMLSDGTIIVAILAPLLVLPMISSGMALAKRGRAWVAITSSVGVVLLNLCLLLPMVIFLRYGAYGAQLDGSNWLHLRFDWSRSIGAMTFGWVSWRVDNVVLVLLGFVLVPTAWGKWRLGRPEGATLIGLYVAYILMEAVAGLRP